MNLDLTNKNALVGGGSEGLGLASAIELAALGANVTLISRSEEKLKIALDKLSRNADQTHSYITADYSMPDEAIKSILSARSKPIHILVNNSGGPPAGPVKELNTSDYQKGFDMHFKTTHELTQALIPEMESEGFGRIVNILSISVQQPIDELPVSNMIRAGIASWTKTMSNALASKNITINNVLPGYTMTARMEYVFSERAKLQNTDIESVTSAITSQIPARRFAEPSEIGNVVAFLCTDAASYITGSNIPVDGGFIKGNH